MSEENEDTTTTRNNMDMADEHKVEPQQLGMEGCILYDSKC